MRSLLPIAGATEITDADLIAAYAYPTGSGPFVRANFVHTVDGAIRGSDGRSASISSPADHRVFHVMRGLADVVVAGAGTVRAEGYGPAEVEAPTLSTRRALGQRDVTVVAVATASLDVDLDGPLLREPSDAVVVLTSASAPPDVRRAIEERVTVLVVGDEHVDPRRAVDALADHGLPRVLCEGGPTLLGAWVAAGVLDELCLTASPLLVGGTGPRITRGPGLHPPIPLHLAGLISAQDVLFTRWRTGPVG